MEIDKSVIYGDISVGDESDTEEMETNSETSIPAQINIPGPVNFEKKIFYGDNRILFGDEK